MVDGSSGARRDHRQAPLYTLLAFIRSGTTLTANCALLPDSSVPSSGVTVNQSKASFFAIL